MATDNLEQREGTTQARPMLHLRVTTVLTGVFDPPPEALAVPWVYLVVLIVAAIASVVLAVMGAQAASRRPVVEAMRDL